MNNEIGQTPELAWIPLEKLVIDKSYQRTTATRASQKNIEHIRQNFNWASCGALTVAAAADGTYAVIDGQHRMSAAKLREDITQMPCLIVGTIAPQGQAVSFSAINSRRVSLNGLAQYHAAVAAGDPDACGLAELLQEAGVEIPRAPVLGGKTGPYQTQAVGTLLKMLGKHSRSQILRTLAVIPAAYGEENGQLRAC